MLKKHLIANLLTIDFFKKSNKNPCREETKIFTINKSLMQFLIILVS